MRCLLLTALAALPGCNLITDFDRDLVVVLEVLGDIREPRLGPVQEARVGRCEEFCELMRDCIRGPGGDPTCDYVAPGRDHSVANESFALNSCVGICLTVNPEEAIYLNQIRTCDLILAEAPLPEPVEVPIGEDPAEEDPAEESTLRALASKIFCGGSLSICETIFCAPQLDGTIPLETCIGIDLEGHCELNCERYLPAEYWACVGQDFVVLSTTLEEDEGVLCQSLAYCAGSLTE